MILHKDIDTQIGNKHLQGILLGKHVSQASILEVTSSVYFEASRLYSWIYGEMDSKEIFKEIG